ncbi:MAG: YraN family protein [Rectinema sp.]
MTTQARAVLTGRAGEERVARLLVDEGWSIEARNFRRGPGELDIIARKKDLVAFIEVKTWPRGRAIDLERALNGNKRHRIVETSKIFLALHRQYSEARVRYDVFLLTADGSVERFEEAFTGEP